MKKTLILSILIIASNQLSAQVTWSANVASIIYSKCSNCHNANGIAPFQLMSYQDAVQNATDIKNQVTNRTMPPWPPDPTYSHLAHERILPQQQIDAIANCPFAIPPICTLYIFNIEFNMEVLNSERSIFIFAVESLPMIPDKKTACFPELKFKLLTSTPVLSKSK